MNTTTINNAKEISFKPCYINDRKCAVVSYDNGISRILFNAQALGAGNGTLATRAEYAAAGQSLHQFNNYINLLTRREVVDVIDIQNVIPGATVIWHGTKEYADKVAAAAGTRGGQPRETTESTETTETTKTVETVDFSEVLRAALVGAAGNLGGMLAATIAPEINAAAGKIIDEATAAARKESTGAKVDVIRVIMPTGETREITGRKHPQLDAVVNLTNMGRNVYAYGPAGSGKSVAAKQLADALGVDFYPTQKIDDQIALTGFIDAGGTYHATAFSNAFTKGGLFFADEIDLSDNNAVGWLLGALENGICELPGLGVVTAHPNFYCMAAGNTNGTGATAEYCAANVQTPAFRARFAFVPVGYAPEIEEANAGGDMELLQFCRELRAAAAESGVSLVVSPREIKWLHKCDGIFTPADNLSYNLFKGLDVDQLAMLSAKVSAGNKWAEALKTLAA